MDKPCDGDPMGVDRSWDVEGRDVFVVVVLVRDKVEAVGGKAGVLLLCGRCASGNRGSGCFGFRRPRRKKLLLVELVCVLVVVLPNPPLCSPELASDLDDSERRCAGGVRAESWWPGGPGCDLELCGRGRGSWNVTACLLPTADASSSKPVIDFLLSFLLGASLKWPSGLSRGISPERRILIGSFIRDFLWFKVESIVGAVVIMAGAAKKGARQ